MCANDERAGKCSCHWNWRAGHASLSWEWSVVLVLPAACVQTIRWHRRTNSIAVHSGDTGPIRFGTTTDVFTVLGLSRAGDSCPASRWCIEIVLKWVKLGLPYKLLKRYRRTGGELDGCCIIREDTVPSLWY
jgi:hypothetical protein